MNDRQQFIEDNLRLVHACCHKLQGRGIEYDDLYSAGCIGLVKAVDGFDPDKGFRFSTYAVPVILGEIRRLFREDGTVKVGRRLKELSRKVQQTANDLRVSRGRQPHVSEVAAALDISEEQAAQALSAAQPVLSLTYENDEGHQMQRLPAADQTESLIGTLALKQTLQTLDEQDRRLIVLRYFQDQTQAQPARVLGTTQVQVSRRERAILMKMRRQLTS